MVCCLVHPSGCFASDVATLVVARLFAKQRTIGCTPPNTLITAFTHVRAMFSSCLTCTKVWLRGAEARRSPDSFGQFTMPT
jgi:hypothetical protein